MLPMKLYMYIFVCVFSIYANRITVPKAYSSIQSAIDNAMEGDTIYINNGVYKTAIELKEGVIITGESLKGTIISGTGNHPVIKAANRTIISNLTVQNGSIGILSENSACTITHVIIRNNGEAGIHCYVTLPDISNCIIYKNRWSGIFCESTRSIKTSIIHNIIAENGYNGITLEGTSEVLIMNNIFFSNKQYGIWGKPETYRSRIIYNNFYNNRSLVNTYLRRDPSNNTENPGFSFNNGVFNYTAVTVNTLKGKGKDGAPIGLINPEILRQKQIDPDKDGIMEGKDNCPNLPEDFDAFEDDDGCPEFDNDKDGVYDSEDTCPNSPEDFDGFKDDDGCFDPDNDGDNIPDSIDVCKEHPETENGYKDEDGCPDEIPSGKAVSPPVE